MRRREKFECICPKYGEEWRFRGGGMGWCTLQTTLSCYLHEYHDTIWFKFIEFKNKKLEVTEKVVFE